MSAEPEPTNLDPVQGSARVSTDRGEAVVVDEAPLLIALGGEHVLTMRTPMGPAQDEELALGFVAAEGIADAQDVAEVLAQPAGDAAAVDAVSVVLREGLALPPAARERLVRAHAIRPSCGLCGLTSAADLTRGLTLLPAGTPRTTLARLAALAETMRESQPLFRATGGCHAAMIVEATTGTHWVTREDVGRHNALDRALGACLRAGRDLSQAALLLSGRAGYELVLKALRCGVPIVASVSAPTRLAVELASEQGQTLVGFLRDGTGRVYWDEDRLQQQS